MEIAQGIFPNIKQASDKTNRLSGFVNSNIILPLLNLYYFMLFLLLLLSCLAISSAYNSLINRHFNTVIEVMGEILELRLNYGNLKCYFLLHIDDT